jgi:hypothetical protein
VAIVAPGVHTFEPPVACCGGSATGGSAIDSTMTTTEPGPTGGALPDGVPSQIVPSRIAAGAHDTRVADLRPPLSPEEN